MQVAAGSFAEAMCSQPMMIFLLRVFVSSCFRGSDVLKIFSSSCFRVVVATL
jgi:hypothetical protein